MGRYIYQKYDWPQFVWDDDVVMHYLGKVRHLQGKIIGNMEALGFDLRDEAVLKTLTLDVLKSSEIEGEILNLDQVRSSIARRLGMDVAGLVPSERHVDGVVEMLVDATQGFDRPLTADRLFGWHAALFPSGRSGMYTIKVGAYRDDANGPMQVISGPFGRERVHFQAPPASDLPSEMDAFLQWFNKDSPLDPVLKAALAHLWFVTVHPFEDGNGRMARALTDLLLARGDDCHQRFYSMSAQIQLERNHYYNALEHTQKGMLNVTDWVIWFLECLFEALKAAQVVLESVVQKHRFWQKNGLRMQNDRQKKVLTRLLDGFQGKMTSSKWAKIGKFSADTALRDIQDLLEKGILEKAEGGGRSAGYLLVLV